jgi:hypothetical protein
MRAAASIKQLRPQEIKDEILRRDKVKFDILEWSECNKAKFADTKPLAGANIDNKPYYDNRQSRRY